MGDISEMRGIVVVITFLATLVLLINLFPSGFYAIDYHGRDVYVPELFEFIDIQSFAQTKPVILNVSGADYGEERRWDIDIGEHDFDLYYTKANKSKHNLRLVHYWSEWVFAMHQYGLMWFNLEGLKRSAPDEYGHDAISGETIQLDFTENVSKYRCVHPEYFEVRVFVAYNTTAYSGIIDAWNHYALHVMFGIDFDQTSTGYSAWAMISMLMFWQLPDIHWIIQVLISAPLWACVAYIAYILILRAIGAIFGGGGA